jgi:branched-chain amino acid transport system ATP-binding protein
MILEVQKLNTGYGKLQVLFDLSMHINGGEIVAVIGPNGSGKSTILRAVSGILPVWSGDILFEKRSIVNNATSENIAAGLTFSPQGNRIFTELSVLENLEIAGFLMEKERLEDRIASVLAFFPVLKSKLKSSGGSLSGGEQQILALARALIPSPKLLLLDEPSLGLAPNLISDLFEKLVTIKNETDLSIIIVEQKVTEILEIANRVYAIKLGKVAFEGKTTELRDNKQKLKAIFL